LSIGRFQVMAVLQAARAYVLGLPLTLAKSWGLNRAIFYAAAKKGYFRGRKAVTRISRRRVSREELKKEPIKKEENMFFLGDEGAYVTEIGGKTYFIIGNKPQTEEDFRRQIESRFSPIFDEIWKEAVEYVSQFSKEVLLSQRQFYEKVYKPVRDLLARKWSEKVREARERMVK